MGAITHKFQEKVDCVVTECYIYSVASESNPQVNRVKVQRALWDTGASGSLISARVAKALGLKSIGKTGVSGYNKDIDVKDTYLVHVGISSGDVFTNIMAMECESDEYDAVIGMDIIGLGDFAVTNKDDKTTFSFRVPSDEEIVFEN